MLNLILQNDNDLHDIADGTHREKEVNDISVNKIIVMIKIMMTKILIFKKTSICLSYKTLFPIE